MEAHSGNWIFDAAEEDTMYYFIMYTDSMTINETTLRAYKPGAYTSVAIGSGELVIEKLGSLLNECGYLRCYEDAELGFHNTGLASDCEMIFTNIEPSLSQNEISIKVFPNPIQEHSTLHISNIPVHLPKSLFLEIFDFQGKKVKKYALENHTPTYSCPVDNLTEGIYLVVLKSQEKVAATQKLIIK